MIRGCTLRYAVAQVFEYSQAVDLFMNTAVRDYSTRTV
eukprot:COSAG02_NODE_57622_length_280_cov_0.569061_1_plen_37_part_01